MTTTWKEREDRETERKGRDGEIEKGREEREGGQRREKMCVCVCIQRL